MARAEPSSFLATARAAKVLRTFGIERPVDIQVEDIAWAMGIEISYAPLKGAEAHLIRVGESGAITVRNDIADVGRTRFAIAHELGHWELHRDISQFFLCTNADMREYLSSGPELEANTFASELLMPRSMLPKTLWETEPSLSQPRAIAEEFNVTLTSAAVRWAEVARVAVIAVFSDGQRVSWWRRNEANAGNLWLESQQAISDESRARWVLSDEPPGRGGDTIEVPWEVWFPHIKKGGDVVRETSIRLGNYGAVLSMLWVPEMDI